MTFFKGQGQILLKSVYVACRSSQLFMPKDSFELIVLSFIFC